MHAEPTGGGAPLRKDFVFWTKKGPCYILSIGFTLICVSLILARLNFGKKYFKDRRCPIYPMRAIGHR